MLNKLHRRVRFELIVELVFVCFFWLHIGSTKMRILSIFAGKSKTMENQQNQHFYMFLCTVGGGVANSLNDASHLPHLAELFITLYYTCCELTEGSPRRNHTFTSSIRRASSEPGIVRTRKRVSKVGKCVKFKQITYFSGDKFNFEYNGTCTWLLYCIQGLCRQIH